MPSPRVDCFFIGEFLSKADRCFLSSFPGVRGKCRGCFSRPEEAAGPLLAAAAAAGTRGLRPRGAQSGAELCRAVDLPRAAALAGL